MKASAWAALFFCAVACLASLWLGQDANFDLRNYHVYNAWAALTGRWSQDIFVAGGQTYFSPFLDVPYYMAAAALLPSHGAWLVALAGLPYGILLYLIYLISRRVADSLALGTWDRRGFVAACVLLAGTGAATWSMVGTSFNDITMAGLVLAAFHQVLTVSPNRGDERWPRKVAAAGMLLGSATALKLNAAVYVPSMAAAILAVAPGWRRGIRSLALYGCCVTAAFLVIYGPWAWRLYALTGNPFFPLFNGVFHSDWMASIDVRDERFLPRSWVQWLFYPFYWVRLQSSLVTEVAFRDMRLAIAYVLVVGSAALALIRKEPRARFLHRKHAPMRMLVVFVVVSYAVWLREFSILRYLVATECLAGILVAIAIMTLVRGLGRRAAWMPALCAIPAVALVIGYGVAPRWGRVPTGTDFLRVQAPALERGALLIFAGPPMSFLAPRLAAANEGLQFMTIPGGFAITRGQFGADGFRHELGRRMRAKVAANRKSLYVMLLKRRGAAASPDLAAFGISIDMRSCRPVHSPLIPELVLCRAIYGTWQAGGSSSRGA